MKTIVIIINGVRMPYNVIHHAIERAKADSCEIFALFLRGKHEPSKGYIFPSDMATTEIRNAEREAEIGDEKILSDNMDLVQQMITDENVSYQSALIINASVEEVAKLTVTADLIVVDENFDNPSLLKDDKITLKALMHKVPIPFDRVP